MLCLNYLSISSLVWHPLLCISLYQSCCLLYCLYNTFLDLISGCVFIKPYPECLFLKCFHKQCINIQHATVFFFLVFVQDFGLKNFLSICRETKVLWRSVFTSTTRISVWSTPTLLRTLKNMRDAIKTLKIFALVSNFASWTLPGHHLLSWSMSIKTINILVFEM